MQGHTQSLYFHISLTYLQKKEKSKQVKMRMSCNGCRVLRKGCSDDCSIRPCLEWIKTPDSQANATVFLAKFYGRAGLMNLINAGPPHLRPAVFRSLLYEACGRIVNPIHGSVGLMWSGSWQLCQRAVEAVLKGAPVAQMAADAAEAKIAPPFKAYDIRHVNKEDKCSGSTEVHRVRNRRRFKRSGAKSKRVRASAGSADESGSHESSLIHQCEAAAEPCMDRERLESESLGSAENAEPGTNSATEDDRQSDEGEIELELTLGFEPLSRCVKMRCEPAGGSAAGACKMELRLDCPSFATDGSC